MKIKSAYVCALVRLEPSKLISVRTRTTTYYQAPGDAGSCATAAAPTLLRLFCCCSATALLLLLLRAAVVLFCRCCCCWSRTPPHGVGRPERYCYAFHPRAPRGSPARLLWGSLVHDQLLLFCRCSRAAVLVLLLWCCCSGAV